MLLFSSFFDHDKNLIPADLLANTLFCVNQEVVFSQAWYDSCHVYLCSFQHEKKTEMQQTISLDTVIKFYKESILIELLSVW